MGAKSWIVILGLGLGAVIAMGLMTTYLVDSRPDLRATIVFKAAFAEEFAEERFEDVSLRRLPERRGYQLRVAREPVSGAELADLDRRIAEYFIEHFAQNATGSLRLIYSSPGGFGCSQPEPYRQSDVALRELRVAMADRRKEDELRRRLRDAVRLELLTVERQRGDLVVDVRPVAAAPPGATSDTDGLLELAEDVRRVVGEVVRFRRLRVRIAPPQSAAGAENGANAAPGESSWLREVLFDGRGRILDAP